MNANATTGGELGAALEDLAAELAEAAYPIVLRNGSVHNWLDLELELWRALRQTVGKWAAECPPASVIRLSLVQPESEAP